MILGKLLKGGKKEADAKHILTEKERDELAKKRALEKRQNSYEERQLEKEAIKRQEAIETQEYLRKNKKQNDDKVLAGHIRDSLLNSRVTFFYQPAFDTRIGQPIFHEVFTHMREASGRTISPVDYLPVAHGFGLATWLDEVVFSLVAKQEEQGTTLFSINLTGETLAKHDDFFDKLMEAVMEHGLAPNTILFELKFMDIQDDAMTALFIQEASNMQFRFILDYIGGGSRVIQMIKKLGFSYVKLDAPMFAKALKDSAALQNLKEIIAEAQKCSLPVIMERVETKRMYDLCQSVGIHHIQGYYTSRPAENIKTKMVLSEDSE